MFPGGSEPLAKSATPFVHATQFGGMYGHGIVTLRQKHSSESSFECDSESNLGSANRGTARTLALVSTLRASGVYTV